MNRLSYQVQVIKDFSIKLEEFINEQVDIKVNQILKNNNIIDPKKALIGDLFDELFPQYKDNEQQLTHFTKLNKRKEVRGQKVFKRLKEMGLNHKDMIKFRETKLPLYVIAKILNLGEKTIRGYYQNYTEGKK